MPGQGTRRQQTALQRCCKRNAHIVFFSTGKNERIRRAIQQTPRIGNHRSIKLARINVRTIGIGIIRRNTDKPHHTLILQFSQRPQRAIFCHHLLHGKIHWIVNVQYVKRIQTQPRLTAFHLLHHPVEREIVFTSRPSHFCRHRTLLSQIGAFAQRTTNNFFTRGIPVKRRRIDQRTPGLNSSHHILYPHIFINPRQTAICPHHTSEKCRAKTYDWNLQPRSAQYLTLHRNLLLKNPLA